MQNGLFKPLLVLRYSKENTTLPACWHGIHFKLC